MPLTPRQISDLRQRFLGLDATSDFATVDQGTKAESAYAAAVDGNHESRLDALEAPTSNGNVAFGWGNHASAGYYAAATIPFLRKLVGDGYTATVTLPTTPFTGSAVSAVQVFVDPGTGPELCREIADAGTRNYTIEGAVITFGTAITNTDIVHVYYYG